MNTLDIIMNLENMPDNRLELLHHYVKDEIKRRRNKKKMQEEFENEN